jgi:hypothetical protein
MKSNKIAINITIISLFFVSINAMWPSIQTFNGYIPNMQKEHTFLAVGLLGGACIGAGLYAAYHAIKYCG